MHRENMKSEMPVSVWTARRSSLTLVIAMGAIVLVALVVGSGVAHAKSFAEAAGAGMGNAFLFALTAGLLTALTPCVYPMIPITIAPKSARTSSTCSASVLSPLEKSGRRGRGRRVRATARSRAPRMKPSHRGLQPQTGREWYTQSRFGLCARADAPRFGALTKEKVDAKRYRQVLQHG